MAAATTDPACYFKYPKQTPGGGQHLDFAASVCIFHELGLPVGDFTGGLLQLNNPHTTHMHEGGIIYTTQQQLFDDIIGLYKEYFTK